MKIGIIGGGAAGMMAALTIRELNPDVEIVLIEKNMVLGRKVMISGGGRCNVTTGYPDLRTIMDFYPRGKRWLASAMNRFSPEQVYEFFESQGVPLKTEKDNRVFPVSNNGKDVVGIFEKFFDENRVEVLTQHEVERIEEGFSIFFKDQEPIHLDKLILTTGGQAYRHTGSTGDGYAFAESLGHTITPLAPSLNSFLTQDDWPKSLTGISLQKVSLSVKRDQAYTFTGPILFTHKGLSGPAIFALSSLVAFEPYDNHNPLPLELDLVPQTSQDELQKSLHNTIHQNPKKTIRNTLAEWFPKALAGALCDTIGLSPQRSNAEVSKKELHQLIESMKHLSLPIVGRGAGDEFVTAGGIDTSEVNAKTMQSKIDPNLFFAGEILNIDGFTGGFNLQAAWCTGRAAGIAITELLPG